MAIHTKRRRWRLALAGFAVASATALLGTSIATANTGTVTPTNRAVPRLALPAPTGDHPVGTTSLHLVDHSRPDPWNPNAKARELMVSIWYPARADVGKRARYMTPQESQALVEFREVELPPGVPATIASTTRTHARVGAPPVVTRTGHPLVVLSPGFTMPRSSLTAVAEELASHGFVVAAIDHTYETIVQFPDGRLTTCLACENLGQETFEKVIRGRAGDTAFVLDTLTGARPGWRGARLIDPTRIGMAGHSIGGASTWHTMLTDERIAAGINMDGTFFLLEDTTMPRPFLLLGAESHETSEDPTWEAAWSAMTGWKRWLQVQQAHHGTFTDWPLLLDQLGVPNTGPDAIDSTRGIEVTRRYVSAFFTHHLTGTPQPLLDGPSPDYLDVMFWKDPATE